VVRWLTMSDERVGDPNMWTLYNPDSGAVDNFVGEDEVDERLNDLGELAESLEVIPPAGAIDTEASSTDATDEEADTPDASGAESKESPAEAHSASQETVNETMTLAVSDGDTLEFRVADKAIVFEYTEGDE